MNPETPEREQEVRAAARRRVRTPLWNLLLVLPLIATLIPGIYNRVTPRLFDIPFFYWYQLAAILVSVAVTLVVYTKTRD